MSKPKTISEYIKQAPKESQKRLKDMLITLRKAAPKAEEGIKWGSAAFSCKRILFTFAAFKHHIGFYPTPKAMKHFAKELLKYTTGAGSIQFPYDKPMPLTLIKRIAAYRVKLAKEEDARWM